MKLRMYNFQLKQNRPDLTVIQLAGFSTKVWNETAGNNTRRQIVDNRLSPNFIEAACCTPNRHYVAYA